MTRFHADALAAPHTQRELDQIETGIPISDERRERLRSLLEAHSKELEIAQWDLRVKENYCRHLTNRIYAIRRELNE